MIASHLLRSVLACPECGSDIVETDSVPTLPFTTTSPARGLRCDSCDREFAHVDGVYILWSDELRSAYELESAGDRATLTKRANVEVYRDISEEYDHAASSGLPYLDGVRLVLAHVVDAYRGRRRAPIRVDVGCAGGESLDILASAFELSVGVDASWENTLRAASLGHSVILGDAERLPLKSRSISIVTCTAALHHFPRPDAFLSSASEKLEEGGVVVTAFDPSHDQAFLSWPARLVWRLRLPIYRILGRRRGRGYLHTSRRLQELNALAEAHRAAGFSPAWMEATLATAGFDEVRIFFGADVTGSRSRVVPSVRLLVLKLLSAQNPFDPRVSSAVGSIGVRRAGGVT